MANGGGVGRGGVWLHWQQGDEDEGVCDMNGNASRNVSVSVNVKVDHQNEVEVEVKGGGEGDEKKASLLHLCYVCRLSYG